MRGICKNCRKNVCCFMLRILYLHSDWLNMTVIIVVTPTHNKRYYEEGEIQGLRAITEDRLREMRRRSNNILIRHRFE